MKDSLRFYKSEISYSAPCYIIAEIGVNHGGDVELCRQLIDEAKNVGANAVKFQTFKAETLVSPGTQKVNYQKSTTDPNESHYEMIKSLEFSEKDHFEMFEYCRSIGIDFISTPYDVASVDFLERLGVEIYKTASADLVDHLLHERLIETGKPILMATGMASLAEIEATYLLYKRRNAQNRIILMHCVSNYPCQDASVNIKVLNTLKTAFDGYVGYSDHSVGSEAAILAIGFGVKVIEKHFTLNKGLKGPDHKASSDPKEMEVYISSIRRAELMLGSSVKEIQSEEVQMSQVSRKSLFAAKDLKEGDVLSLDDIKSLRPGTGILPIYYKEYIGKKILKQISINTMLSKDMFT